MIRLWFICNLLRIYEIRFAVDHFDHIVSLVSELDIDIVSDATMTLMWYFRTRSAYILTSYSIIT